MNIGIVGLGLMGSAIAERLAAQGFAVLGWNRSDKTIDNLPMASSWDALLAHSDCLILTLSDAQAIQERFFSASTPLDDKLLLQMGTIGPDQSRHFDQQTSERGGRWLEAPVLGSLPEARNGTLIVMAGGRPEDYQRAGPVLNALSNQCRRVGEVGQGAALKLAMNQLIGGLTTAFASSLKLVQAEGLDSNDFMDLLRASALYAPTFDKKLNKMLDQDYVKANFPLKHLAKDMALFSDAAQAHELNTDVTQAILRLLQTGLKMGHGNDDYSALAEGIVSDP
jgi:3-hydroxyisobutyrate dehydrogenase